MDFNTFQPTCKSLVAEYVNRHTDISDGQSRLIQPEEVYVVWFAKTLQNAKALLSTPLPDGMYYEITYNGDKDEFYLDAYKKFENIKITTKKGAVE
jgi:hypothetical protein